MIVDQFVVQITSTNENIRKPVRSSECAAGYDICCNETFFLDPWSRKLVGTGLRFFIPKGCYARIAPRSGLALMGIDIGAGVVDVDYKGEVKVLVINNSPKCTTIHAGIRLCQVILEKIHTPQVYMLALNSSVPHMMDESSRGDNGFGSSGFN